MERVKYNQMLKETKTSTLSEKVKECGRDTKKLYKLVNELTGAEYFLSKIQKIRQSLNNFIKYEPTTNYNAVILNQFEYLSQEEVVSIINSLASKSCETDVLPTKILKKALPGVIEAVTNIVNISISEGVFPRAWKTAIIRPPLKKQGLDLALSNYRPVNNLPFLSKVLEKAVLRQFNKHTEKERLMPDYQSAYRKNYSWEK